MDRQSAQDCLEKLKEALELIDSAPDAASSVIAAQLSGVAHDLASAYGLDYFEPGDDLK